MEKLIKLIAEGRTEIFYNSWTWRKKRLEILERDNNECQLCKEKGRVSKGEVVHHIKHLKDFPRLCLDDENLLTVCYSCHNLLHPEKQTYIGGKKKKYINKERW